MTLNSEFGLCGLRMLSGSHSRSYNALDNEGQNEHSIVKVKFTVEHKNGRVHLISASTMISGF